MPTGDRFGPHARRPTVSILLSNFNHAQYLRESLGGICEQSLAPDEVIVIDDGSSDESVEVIEKFAARYSFITLRNDQRQGPLFSIATALRHASMEYVVWAAADDVLLPNFLERSLAALALYPGAGVCFSRLAVFSGETGTVREFSFEDHGAAFDLGEATHFLSPEALKARLARSYLWMSGNTVLVRRDALFAAGGFRPELRWHADWFAFYVVAIRHGACVVPETLAMIRKGRDTYSQTGMSHRPSQARVLRALAAIIREPQYRDVARLFRARPVLLSPFGGLMLRGLTAHPETWDIAWRYLHWTLTYWAIIFRSRVDSGWPMRYQLRLKSTLLGYLARIVDLLTPSRWKN